MEVIRETERKIVIAIDSFKGSISSVEGSLAIAAGVSDVVPYAERMTMKSRSLILTHSVPSLICRNLGCQQPLAYTSLY